MHSVEDTTASSLDTLPDLPRRNKASIALVLSVQTLNSFNDNFVKMLFISLASAVAMGTKLGDEMQVYLGLVFSLPYILFAPLAGFLSDRYSKRSVVIWMQVAQVLVFGTFAAVLTFKDPFWSLLLSLAAFFLLATEAALFSPAKLGIMKELAGSRRLGMVSGWVQMTMMAGILSGMWAGGTVFGRMLENGSTAWQAAEVLVWVIAGAALLQTVGALGVQRTPVHPEVTFRRAMLWEHFEHMRLLFRDRPVRLAAIGISFFWFISNSMLTILVTMANEAYPADSASASELRSMMAASLGVGIVLGSLFSSWICKRRIELGMVPLAGLGLAGSLLWTGLLPVTSHYIYFSLIFLGFTGGCFMNPLYAYVQDRAVPSERARILSGVNLMDCLAGVVAMAVVWMYLQFHMRSSNQVLTLVLPCLGATLFILKLLPQQLVRFTLTGFLRSLYKVRAITPENLPRTGGVLLLPNHVSYMDALLLSVACERPVRFVIWDTLYHVRWMNGFLRIFDTVPISSTRAKDAIRTVSEALKEGQVICLFPEGQITRCGPMNELRKGFELMARQAKVPVMPVYLDGLWGSVFSFEGGDILNHLPRPVRYPVSVHFGRPVEAAEAKSSLIREAMHALGSEAFLNRKQFHGVYHPQALANKMRIAHVELIGAGDTLLVLSGEDSGIARAVSMLPSVTVVHSRAEAVESKPEDHRLIAIGNADQLAELASWSEWKRLGKFALCWQDAAPVSLPELGTPVLRGWWHEDSGILLSTEFPNPQMPKGEEDTQQGIRPGSLGRLLPGIAYHQEATGLRLSGLAPGLEQSVWLEGGVLDDMGFITRQPAA